MILMLRSSHDICNGGGGGDSLPLGCYVPGYILFTGTVCFMTQVVVQLGDVLDRGENEIAILSLLRSLDEQAKVEGGAVFQVCFT